MKTVSIIVPFWNEEKYIGRCLHSLLAHDYFKGALEVVGVVGVVGVDGVDGMSTDRTLEIVGG